MGRTNFSKEDKEAKEEEEADKWTIHHKKQFTIDRTFLIPMKFGMICNISSYYYLNLFFIRLVFYNIIPAVIKETEDKQHNYKFHYGKFSSTSSVRNKRRELISRV